MLIKKDCTGKTKSIYKCDRCGTEIHTDVSDRFKVFVKKSPKDYEVINSWDLCKRCYISLCKALSKGGNKDGKS